MLSIAKGGCFGRELWCTIVTVCKRQDVVNDTVVGNVGVDPGLSTRDLVQGVSEVSGVGQLGSIWVQVGALLGQSRLMWMVRMEGERAVLAGRSVSAKGRTGSWSGVQQ